MPTYHNTSDHDAVLTGYGHCAPGEMKIVQYYVYPLPTEFELIAHAPAPWRTLYAGTIGSAGVITDLERVGQVVISNNSGDTLAVVVNGDTANPVYVFQGLNHPITHSKEISILTLSGAGEGSVYIYALP